MTTPITQSTTTFSIDPAEGFVQYTQAVKPYHSKILDVLIEYVYYENINVTMRERWSWTNTLVRPNTEVVPSCGFGVIWDSSPYTLNDFPIVVIKQAIGETPIELTFLSDTLHPSNVLISYNPDGYIVNVGDPITFQTTGILPNTTVGIISVGLVYYVTSVSGNILTISRTPTGTSLSFTNTGSGKIWLHQENLKYNSFLVESSTPTQYHCIATNTKANQFTFVNTHNIVAVNPSVRQWTVSGSILAVATVGSTIYVHDNGGSSANGKYIIESASVVGGNTIITVVEQISLLAQNNGTLNIQDEVAFVPNWVFGLSVRVSSSGTLPSPLISTDTYYFTPTTTIGVFNLAKKQFPLIFTDIVDITDLGTGVINIERGEIFYPGAVVSVEDTYLSRNNGTYYIRNTVVEGAYVRVTSLQRVNRTTPPSLLTDGIMIIHNFNGYDLPSFCLPIDVPDLYTDTFIDERITFEFLINFNEKISSLLSEDDAGVHDTKDFFTSTSIPRYGQVLLPMGLDTQYFDIGVLDEDQHYDNHNLGSTI